MARPTRLPGFSYIGRHQYFLTFCTLYGQPLLADPAVDEWVRAQLLQSSTVHGMAVDTYSVMPDHVHLLVKGITASADLQDFMIHLKRETGWRFRRERKRHLWQEGFHDRILRDESEAMHFAAYIVGNGVSEGLSASIETCPRWGSFTRSRDQILRMIGMAGVRANDRRG
ncbi:MAG: transposase [Vicinamibacterales bacterium]